MIRSLPNWVRMPSEWIEPEGLKSFTWAKGQGADHLAALMCFIAITHHADPETGIARLTYDELAQVTDLSRLKLSGGLKVLTAQARIEPKYEGRSGYRLVGYQKDGGWAQLPAEGLYRGNRIGLFADLTMRQRAELDAVKLYLLFAARRDSDTNMAHITYDQIEARSGVTKPYIKNALSVLAANGLVHTEYVPSQKSENGVANAYRLAHLNTRRHMATMGRRMLTGLPIETN